MAIHNPKVQTPAIIVEAFFIDHRRNRNGKTIQTKRSRVMTVSVNTETSLETVDITPANMHRLLARQETSCLKYTPSQIVSL